MELIFPFVLYIGGIITIALCLINLKRKTKYSNGIKVANTKYIKEIPYYKNIIRKYKKLVISLKSVCIVSILMALLISSRIATIDVSTEPMYKRDIFLCLDASTSVAGLNEKIIENLKKTVKSLKEERFGVLIFNTSSVTVVPLTDDYDYILKTLDDMQKHFHAVTDENSEFEDYSTAMDFLTNGTLVGNTEKGSSLVPEGLASCATSFPNIEEKRTRVIILTTDNWVEGNPIISMKEAADFCSSENITVFAIAPNDVKDKNNFENAIKSTGGEVYLADSDTMVSKIVDDINEKERTLVKENNQKRKIDQPHVPFTILIISIFILFILYKKVDV